MKNKLSRFTLLALGWLYATDAAAGCKTLSETHAQAAVDLIKKQVIVAEYCEKCLSPLHRLIGVRSVETQCRNKNECHILLNDEEVDVSHLFAELYDGKGEENIGFAAGCPDALLYNPRFMKFN